MAVNRAEQLRQARELFDFAQREGITMQEAKKRLAERRWKEAEASLASRRCGTVAPSIEPVAGREQPKLWYLQEPFA